MHGRTAWSCLPVSFFPSQGSPGDLQTLHMLPHQFRNKIQISIWLCLSPQPWVSLEAPGQLTQPGSSSGEQEHPAHTMELKGEEANQPRNHLQGCQNQGKSIPKRYNNWNQPKSIHYIFFLCKSSYFCFVYYQKGVQYISYPIKYTYNFCGNKTQEGHKYSQGFLQFRRTL